MASAFEDLVDEIASNLADERRVPFFKLRVGQAEHKAAPYVVWVPTGGTVGGPGNASMVVTVAPGITERVQQLATDTMSIVAIMGGKSLEDVIDLRDAVIRACHRAAKADIRIGKYEIHSQDEKRSGWMLAGCEYLSQQFEVDFPILRERKRLTMPQNLVETCDIQAVDATTPP